MQERFCRICTPFSSILSTLCLYMSSRTQLRSSLLFLFLLLQSFLPSFSHPQLPCQTPHNTYPFCNTSLSISTRAKSLISHLTLHEKITQLSNNASSIPRLGIPSYQWWSESLHGIAANGPGVSFDGPIKSATSYPQVILTASSFNRSLWFSIGEAIGLEGRAMYNSGQAGLTFWAPNVNLFRDPRWGRGQETAGEDPVVGSAYAVEFVRGFQGEGRIGGGEIGRERVLRGEEGEGEDEELMLSACCKHFTAYDLEMWGNFSRYSFNAVVTKQDLEDSYQPPFRSCIHQGKASCLMCSYNSLNGIPACASRELLDEARFQWGFKGYVTSDCDAVATVYEYQRYAKSPEDAVADVLKAGMDIDCGTYLLRNTRSALEQGRVQEEDIDRALVNLFTVQLRLGLFDGNPAKGRFGKLGPGDICTTEHKKLALEAARQGIVLLKNNGNFLPLNKSQVATLAVVGPMANDASKMGGGYSGIPCDPKSLLDGFHSYIKRLSYAAGCLDVACDSSSGFNKAVVIAKKADYVIVVAGLDLSQETEDRDRISLLLPGKQMELVSYVAGESKKPIILVLTGGGPLDVSFAKEDPRIASILWIGYPGETGAQALAEIVFGDFNPGGRLTMTWYPESFTNIPMNAMNMRADPSHGYPGRTYRFYTGDKVYSFGEGLSYTNYTYKFLSGPKKLSILGPVRASSGNKILLVRGDNPEFFRVEEITYCDSLRFLVEISVTNLGDMDGSHVVLLFAKVPKIFSGTPDKQLVGFNRVHASAYGYTETNIEINPCEDLSVATEEGDRVLPLGDYVLLLGDLEYYLTIRP